MVALKKKNNQVSISSGNNDRFFSQNLFRPAFGLANTSGENTVNTSPFNWNPLSPVNVPGIQAKCDECEKEESLDREPMIEKEEQTGSYVMAKKEGESQVASVRLVSQLNRSIQRECANGTWEYEYDGCSLPQPLANFIGIDKDNPAGGQDTHFSNSRKTGACDKHDECYQTCNPFGQSVCDLRMFSNMLATCNASSEPQSVKDQCKRFAVLYYMGLERFGAPFFALRQAEVCTC